MKRKYVSKHRNHKARSTRSTRGLKRTRQVTKYTASRREIKTIDYFTSNTGALIANPQWYLLNALNTGDNFWNRIGKKVVWKSLRIRLQLRYYPGRGGIQDGLLPRFVIIYDRQANKTRPDFSDVFNNVGVTGTSDISRFGCFLNMVNSERFLVLMDQCMPIADDNSTGTSNPSSGFSNALVDGVNKTWVDRYIKLQGLETIYNSNWNGVDPVEEQVNTGAIWLMCFSDNPSVDSELANTFARFSCRMRFYDE